MRMFAAFVAAARKWPWERRMARGVEGVGWEERERKGGGMSRWVRGW